MALHAEMRIVDAPTQEQVAERAYFRYLTSGGSDGHDVDDWLGAERELLLERMLEIDAVTYDFD